MNNDIQDNIESMFEQLFYFVTQMNLVLHN